MLKVKKWILFLINGLIWSAAGINILRIGILSFFEIQGYWVWILTGAAALVFVAFCFMFSAMVKRHKKRITGYGAEKVSVFRFMDVKGYILMLFMMTLGIALRSFKLLPTEFFAAFYCGLGLALSVAGAIFLVYAFYHLRNAKLKQSLPQEADELKTEE